MHPHDTAVCFGTDFSLILTNSCQHDQISPLRDLRGVRVVLKNGNSGWRESKFTCKSGRRGGWRLAPLLDQHLGSRGQRLPLILRGPRGALPSEDTPNPAGGRQSPAWRGEPARPSASSPRSLRAVGGFPQPQPAPAALRGGSAATSPLPNTPAGRRLLTGRSARGTAAPRSRCHPRSRPRSRALLLPPPKALPGAGRGRAAPGGGTALPPAPRRRRRRRGSR